MFDGQAADAESAFSQVKMEDVRKLLKFPKSECPDRNVQTVGFVHHDTSGLDHGAWKIQLFLFNGICMVTVIGNVSLYIVKKDCS